MQKSVPILSELQKQIVISGWASGCTGLWRSLEYQNAVRHLVKLGLMRVKSGISRNVVDYGMTDAGLIVQSELLSEKVCTLRRQLLGEEFGEK